MRPEIPVDRGDCASDVREAARLRDGIGASAPYPHNGSVPTARDRAPRYGNHAFDPLRAGHADGGASGPGKTGRNASARAFSAGTSGTRGALPQTAAIPARIISS